MATQRRNPVQGAPGVRNKPKDLRKQVKTKSKRKKRAKKRSTKKRSY